MERDNSKKFGQGSLAASSESDEDVQGLGDAHSAAPGPGDRSEPGAEGRPATGASAPSNSLEPTPQVLRILDDYMGELENGRQPNIEELVARYPDLGDPGDLGEQLRGCLASLEFLHPKDSQGALVPELQLENGENLPPPNPSLGQLGDFGLIREIGRGGMGIVYEAIQISLHRRVALKVLPFAAALDAKQLQRFKNEALAAAGLHHPHIVPIHSVGSERGVHYYAMQLIEGKSLADAIIELRGQRGTRKEDGGWKTEDRGPRTENQGSKIEGPKPQGATTVENKAVNETPREAHRFSILHPPFSILDPRSSIFEPPSSLFKSRSAFFHRVAQLGIQAAEALGHAHRLGIVHRDIKPANLILDEEGKLWVTDFGLAMVQSNMELTATGDMLGTLRYMSPEQASAKRGLIDQRTDIYSLGATLYELLTLQPAFPEKDRHELLAQIATAEPRLPRRLNSAIPKDLETIVLKSMAKTPQERYLTAEELAEDLKRFLDDRPIRATRPSIPEKAMKWCRRHKALVAGSTLIALAASILAAILPAVIFFERARQTQEAYQAKLKEEERLSKEQQRLIATMVLAHKAFYELSMKPALDRLLKNRDPQTRHEDQESLRKVLAFCQQLADMNSTVPEARFMAAQARRQVAEMFEALGELDNGQEAYGKAIDALEALVAEKPGELEPLYRRELALCRHHLGGLFWTNSKPDRAEQTLQMEMDELESLVADYPTNPDFRQDLANCRINQSLFLQIRGKHHQAEAILLENQPTLQNLVRDFPCLPYAQKALADNHTRLGEVYREIGRREESKQAFRQALGLLERLNSDNPKVDVFQADLAHVFYSLGLLCQESGQLPDSKEAYERSIAFSKRLVADYPLMPDYELGLATEKHQLGVTLFRMKDFGTAEPAFRQAIALLERLVHDFPAKHRYQEELAHCSHNFGFLLESTHKLPEAKQAFARAESLLETLAKQFPSLLDYQSDLAGCWYNRARLLALENEGEKACPLLQQAIDLQVIATKNNPRNPHYYSSLWAQYHLLLELLLENKKSDQVQLVLERAQEQCQDIPPILNNLAWWMVSLPHPPFGNADLGLQMAKKATEKAPQNRDHWNTLGAAYYRAGNWQKSIAALEKSRALRAGGDSYDFLFLAMAHWQLGDKDQAREWYQKATAQRPKTKNEELSHIQDEAAGLLEVPNVPAVGSKGNTSR